ncbi:cytochrome P450 4V2-like [Epargyreus clarus]|uniref:cytochrome P450 4V2-like n=1 Tax=Epargyreus clarus TaxID=520877 RepID=UPI003C306C66
MFLLALAILACVFAYTWWGRRTRRCLANLPSYPQLPLIGNFHQLFGDGRLLYRRLVEMTAISEAQQLPFVLWLGPYPVLALSNLDDIKIVTNTFIDKPYYYNFARIWLGDGLLTAPVETWKRNIKKLAGTFTGGTVEGFQDVFNAQAQKLVRGLKTQIGKAPFDVMQKYLAEITLEAICQTALGVSKISDSIVTKEYYVAFVRTLELLQTRGMNCLLHSDLLFRLTSTRRELMKSVGHLHRVSETVMKKRQEHEESIGNDGFHNHCSEKSKGNFKSFLDILIELNKKDPTFSTRQVRNEVDTIILAGQETVATTLFYTLMMIGCKPDVQDKLYAEMKEIFGESKREVTKEDLSRMSYCEAVINETLRLYPPAPGVLRYGDHELQLESCKVPKGTTYFINFWGVGRSKRYWGPDALDFRPERWQAADIPAAALLAFSTGKRACIGKKYAMSILKTVVAYCVRELVLISEADKMEFKVDLALRPISGNLLQVRLRD